MSSDPLAPLSELEGVADAAATAQRKIQAVHRHRANLRSAAATAAEASVRAARASAGIEGAQVELPDDGAVADPVLAGALRIARSSEPLLPAWRRAPLQVLARMHVLASDTENGRAELGRPVAGTAPRLELLAQLLTGGTAAAPAVMSAVVHGELLAVGAFGRADGLIASAAARLTMVSTGLDPKSLTVPEVAYYRRQSEYRENAAAFATGTPEGLREWLIFCCQTYEAGAAEATSIANASS